MIFAPGRSCSAPSRAVPAESKPVQSSAVGQEPHRQPAALLLSFLVSAGSARVPGPLERTTALPLQTSSFDPMVAPGGEIRKPARFLSRPLYLNPLGSCCGAETEEHARIA